MKHYDIIIVGAGPAGIAAANAARKSSESVVVIDDNHAAGGQIWRGSPIALSAEFLPSARVIDGNPAEKQITVETSQVFQLSYSKLILATGARELFLPFPGWTLPNVFGVGGLQALAKSGLCVKGKRVIVAGSGPLLLAVAAFLREQGAIVPFVAEQTTWAHLVRFGLTLVQHPSKLKQAMEIRRSIAGTRYLPNSWVTRASGSERVEGVTVRYAGKELRESCEYLAVAFGFVPNTELAQLLGCELNRGFVTVDRFQLTSLPDIYCAGELTGLGGMDESLLEGEVAGLAATGHFPSVNRRKSKHFSKALADAFELRSELQSLATPETIICRCEDVQLSRLHGNVRSWSEAKLHFRCGMGPCQGRVCGSIIEKYFGCGPDSVRPPIFPTRVENLIGTKETTHL